MSIKLVINDEGDYNKVPEDADYGTIYYTSEEFVDNILASGNLSICKWVNTIDKFGWPYGYYEPLTREDALEKLK